MALTEEQHDSVIRARLLIEASIEVAEQALTLVNDAGLSTSRLERATVHLTEAHVACSEALR